MEESVRSEVIDLLESFTGVVQVNIVISTIGFTTSNVLIFKVLNQ